MIKGFSLGRPTQLLIAANLLMGLVVSAHLLLPAQPGAANAATTEDDQAALPEFGNTGVAAPPIPMENRLLVSASSKAWDSRMSSTIDGAAAIEVIRSCSIYSSALPTSHLYIITIRRPPRRLERNWA